MTRNWSEELAYGQSQIRGLPWREGVALSDIISSVRYGSLKTPGWVELAQDPFFSLGYEIAHPQGFKPAEGFYMTEDYLRGGPMSIFEIIAGREMEIVLTTDYGEITLEQLALLDPGLAESMARARRFGGPPSGYLPVHLPVVLPVELPTATLPPTGGGTMPTYDEPGGGPYQIYPPSGISTQPLAVLGGSAQGRVIKTWYAGTRQFAMVDRNGRHYIGTQKKDGTVKYWPVYRPIVIGKNPTRRQVSRATHALKVWLKTYRSVASLLGYHVQTKASQAVERRVKIRK